MGNDDLRGSAEYVNTNNSTQVQQKTKKCYFCYVIIIFGLSSFAFFSLPHFSYYFKPTPFNQLIQISGEIADSKISQGLLIKTKNNQVIKLYCDNPKAPIRRRYSRTAVEDDTGDCSWMLRNKCDENKKYCYDFFKENTHIHAYVDKNKTIYQIDINKNIFFSYDEISFSYKKYFIEYNVIFLCYILSLLFVFFNLSRNRFF